MPNEKALVRFSFGKIRLDRSAYLKRTGLPDFLTRLSVEQTFGPNHKIVTGRLFNDFNGLGCTAAQRVLTEFGVSFELTGVEDEPLFDLVIVAAGKLITASAVTEDEVREHVGETIPGFRTQ